MISLFFRNLFFTALHPGIVVGLGPFWILGNEMKIEFDHPLKLHHYAGATVFVTGLIIMLVCIVSFALIGGGTLSPADPTKKLVAVGLYRFSRNPMYIGVMMMLIGEAVFFQSVALWGYSLCVFIAFNIFIIRVEEPRLRRDFGETYGKYCERVRRWM